MPTLTVFKTQNNLGQNLLDEYIKPICHKTGVNLREAPENANRGFAVAAQATSDFILWDCSLEHGHVYNALNMWVKTTRKHGIVSRTPLPRNVLTYFQCAPIHGETFSNEIIGEWLDKQLPTILQGKYTDLPYRNKILARHYWMFEKPAKYFLSFRGTHQKKTRKFGGNASNKHTKLRFGWCRQTSIPTLPNVSLCNKCGKVRHG